MTRTIRIVLALAAILALAAVPAAAHKSHGGGHDGPSWKSDDDGGRHHGKRHGHRHGHRGVLKFKAGTTTLELDAGTVGALTGAGFTVSPVAPATAAGTTFSFPITNGRVKYRGWGAWWKLKAVVDHSGGITFTKGATSVTASDPRIKVGRHRAKLVTTIGTARVKLLDLRNVAVADGKGTANAVLSGQAAAALNAAFGVTLFTPGLAIGKVTVTPSV